MTPEIVFDLKWWGLGIILDFNDGAYFLHLGPLCLAWAPKPPHVTMQDLDRARAEQYADWMAELEDAGLIQRVEIVQRLPSSDKVM